MAVVWLLVRVYIGWAWFEAGLHKIQDTGANMNMNFMLAGSASSNPVLLILAIALVLAWKTAGHIGLDRFLLPLLGTPWRAPNREIPPTQRAPVPQLA